MTEEKATFPIKQNSPDGPTHPVTTRGVLNMITEKSLPSQEIIPLVDYMRDIAGKPRGSETTGKEDLNSPREDLILKIGDEIKVASLQELQEILQSSGLNVELLGVQAIGNSNQKVTAVVQGVNREKPTSGFERPVVEEGPHMILAPYAIDKNGKLHIFRTVQMRTGEAVIDTPRGFADASSRESGQQMYDIDNAGDKVKTNMQRIVGEESGDALKIKRVTFLGSPRVNSSFVRSKSAIFGVEVDYEAFLKNTKVITDEELKRRQDEFEHEGLVGGVLDLEWDEYINYKRDSSVDKDMAADFGSDTVVIDFLGRKLSRLQRIVQEEGNANRQFKSEDPAGYIEHSLRRSKIKHADRYDDNKAKAEAYLSKLYSGKIRPDTSKS